MRSRSSGWYLKYNIADRTISDEYVRFMFPHAKRLVRLLHNTELLNETLFRSLAHARLMLDAWREDYNHHRPHSKLGWLTPAGYAARWTEDEELERRPSEALDDDRTPVPAG